MRRGESETKPLKRIHGFFRAKLRGLTRPTPITFTIHFATPFFLSHLFLGILKRKEGLVEGSCFDFLVDSAKQISTTTNVLTACTLIIIATSTVWSKFPTSLRCIVTRVGDKTTTFSKLVMLSTWTPRRHPKDTNGFDSETRRKDL